MDNGLINKIVRRSNVVTLLWSLACFLVIGILIVFNVRYLYNFILGPVDISQRELLQISSDQEIWRYWVNAEGDDLVNTGVQYVETSDSGSETVKSTYFAMYLGDRLLLVNLEGNQYADSLPPQVTGWLAPISSEESSEIIEDIETEYPELTGVFLPYKLETGLFRFNGIIGIIISLILLVIGAILGAFFLLRTIKPNEHPTLKSLARFGPIDMVIPRIESELSMPHTTIKNLHLTNSWLVYATHTGLYATQYSDIVWVYMHLLKHKTYGVTVGKTYSALVYDRYGVQGTINAGNKEASVTEILEKIIERAPWAVRGFNNDIQKMWKKERAKFLDVVANRKAEAGPTVQS